MLREGLRQAPHIGFGSFGFIICVVGIVEQPELVHALPVEADPEVDGAPRFAFDHCRPLAKHARRWVRFQGNPQLPGRVAGQTQSTAQLGAEDLDPPIGTSP